MLDLNVRLLLAVAVVVIDSSSASARLARAPDTLFISSSGAVATAQNWVFVPTYLVDDIDDIDDVASGVESS